MRCVIRICLTVLILCALGACARTRPTHHYLLGTLPDTAAQVKTVGASSSPTMRIVRVELPDYLDRSQIVTRSGKNEVELGEFQRWAEPLKIQIARVLAENLSVLVPGAPAVEDPVSAATTVARRVRVRVRRFEGRLGGEMLLDATWNIETSAGQAETPARHAIYREAAGPTYPSLVEEQRRLLERLSRDIAEVLGPRP